MSTNYLFVRRNQVVGNSAHMSIAQNLQKIRNSKGISQQKLADMVGVRQNTIVAIESGETKKSKFLPEIAHALGVSVKEIDPNAPNENFIVPGKDLVGAVDLPVYATVEAGEGAVVLSSEPVQTVKRPEPLATVKDGYGVLVVGDSMSPVVRPGAIVLIHPHLPPSPDDVCLFIHEENGDFRATLKEYRGQTSDVWKVKRYSPEEREFTLKKREFPKCQVVVGWYRR